MNGYTSVTESHLSGLQEVTDGRTDGQVLAPTLVVSIVPDPFTVSIKCSQEMRRLVLD